MRAVWREPSVAVGEKEGGKKREQSFATTKVMICEGLGKATSSGTMSSHSSIALVAFQRLGTARPEHSDFSFATPASLAMLRHLLEVVI